jgi:hypothetical protein
LCLAALLGHLCPLNLKSCGDSSERLKRDSRESEADKKKRLSKT